MRGGSSIRSFETGANPMPMLHTDQFRPSAPLIGSRRVKLSNGRPVQSARRQRRARVTQIVNGGAVAFSLILVALIFIIF